MSFLEYTVLSADLSNQAGSQLADMMQNRRDRKRAAWIIERVEAFIHEGAEAGHRVVPERGGGRVEVYAVPPPADLAKPPGALALMRVDHVERTIELSAIVVDRPAAEGPVWDQIREIAHRALEGR